MNWLGLRKKLKEIRMVQPRVAIILPSRGLIFAQVEEYIENVRDTYPNIRVYRSHNKPIPDCFNFLFEQALIDENVKYLWSIEEDTLPPEKTLDKFLVAMEKYDIACCDYGFNGGWNTTVRSSVNNEILFCGFGCTFFKREVFEKWGERPFFRSDLAFNISNMQWYPTDPMKVYGHFDIRFCADARKKGFTFTQIEGECSHLQLISLGTKEVNNGCHLITEKDRIARKLTLPFDKFK